MGLHHLPLAYVGPDTILPITSVLAALGGILLICWRYVLEGVKRFLRLLLRKSPAESGSSAVTAAVETEGGSEGA